VPAFDAIEIAAQLPSLMREHRLGLVPLQHGL